VRRWCLLIETSGFVVSVSNNQLPVKFELAQNYPNPFNPSTNIKYAILSQSLVKLAVYDILGRQIKILVNELKQPGNYEVTFDAGNIATGVYFYKLEAGDFVDVKKMVLMK
jgi:formylmethanofuran dehydrogenase subunit A